MIWKLVHPEHGATIVYSQGEADSLKAAGWVEFVKTSPVVEAVVHDAPKRRGRPPKVTNDGDSSDAD